MSTHYPLSIHSEVVEEHNHYVVQPPDFSLSSIRKYVSSRIPSLFVSREELSHYTKSEILNPFRSLSMLSRSNWLHFFLGFWVWSFDAFDYFAVSINLAAIAESLDRSVADVSWSITLVLMLRSVGAFLFGIMGDHYGRRWPLIINLIILSALQIGTGFVSDFKSFLAVRALFGCFMGGIQGNAASFGIEDAPVKARGAVTGLFQQGYAFGYLLAVIFTRAIVDNSPKGWRAIFWFTSGPPVIFMIGLFFTPETKVTQRMLDHKKLRAEQKSISLRKESVHQFFETMKTYWLILIYCVLMMAGLNFMSHGSQDLYPTLLTKQLGFGPDRSTVTNSVANLGAITGGFLVGHFSTFIGRRLTIIVFCVIGGALIYPWAYSRNSGINAGAFFFQFCVQGNWSVVLGLLIELVPVNFRSLWMGLSYQLGNLVSSASSTIESTIGERFPIHIAGEEDVYDYSKVMSIFMGCVFAYTIIIMLVGPERRNTSLDYDRDTKYDFDGVGEKDSLTDSLDHPADKDKPKVKHVEETV